MLDSNIISGKAAEDALNALNARFFVTVLNGKTVIACERDAQGHPLPELEFSSPRDFAARYEHTMIQFGTARTPLGKAWRQWPGRRQYDRLVFQPGAHPGGNPSGGPSFNLWPGFGVQPRPGHWPHFHAHLRDIVCQGDEASLNYLFGWMAHLVQRPWELPEVAVVMRGPEGAGKGTVLQPLRAIVTPRCFAHVVGGQLLSRFNNDLAHRLLIYADELQWNEKRQSGRLQTLITEPTVQIEKKAVDRITLDNYARVVVSTNAEWAVPARASERRYFVLDVSGERCGDSEYFDAIHRELANGGLEAFFHALLHADLSGFNVRARPRTAALAAQAELNQTALEQWWQGRLEDGEIGGVPWPEWMWFGGTIYESYASELTRRGEKVESPRLFGSQLRKLMPEPGPVRSQRRVPGRDNPVWGWQLPSLDTCRREWDRRMHTEHDWPQPDNIVHLHTGWAGSASEGEV